MYTAERYPLPANTRSGRFITRKSASGRIIASFDWTEEESAKIQKPEEKKKVEGQVDSRIAEIKKKHEQEQAELEKRQKSEEEKVQTKKAPVKKKKDPDKS